MATHLSIITYQFFPGLDSYTQIEKADDKLMGTLRFQGDVEAAITGPINPLALMIMLEKMMVHNFSRTHTSGFLGRCKGRRRTNLPHR